MCVCVLCCAVLCYIQQQQQQILYHQSTVCVCFKNKKRQLKTNVSMGGKKSTFHSNVVNIIFPCFSCFMMMMTARVKLLKYFNWTKVGTIYQNLPRYSLVSFFCCSFFPYIPCRCFFNGCHFFFCILFPNILIAIIIISITNVLTGFKTLYFW